MYVILTLVLSIGSNYESFTTLAPSMDTCLEVAPQLKADIEKEYGGVVVTVSCEQVSTNVRF